MYVGKINGLGNKSFSSRAMRCGVCHVLLVRVFIFIINGKYYYYFYYRIIYSFFFEVVVVVLIIRH